MYGQTKQTEQTRREAAERAESRRELQWTIDRYGRYRACGSTCARLPAGAYEPTVDIYDGGGVFFQPRRLQLDELVDFPGSLPARILEEIDRFWTMGERFRKSGFLHRRGYLLYGKQGSGKSSLVHQLVARITAQGHLAFFCDSPTEFISCVEQFRSIEPDRPIVCVFEDIDAMFSYGRGTALLQWLDGNCQVDKAVSIATTNYPEKLQRRVVARPRRFDRVLRIESPDAPLRDAYLRRKLPDLSSAERTRWVELTEGLTFAALAELIISVRCLDNDLLASIETLKQLDRQSASSKECDGFDDNGAMDEVEEEEEYLPIDG